MRRMKKQSKWKIGLAAGILSAAVGAETLRCIFALLPSENPQTTIPATKELPKGFHELFTSNECLRAPLIHKSLENLVTFVSTMSEEEPYNLYAIINPGDKPVQLCRLKMAKGTRFESAFDYAATSGYRRYDVMHIVGKGNGFEIGEIDMEELENKKTHRVELGNFGLGKKSLEFRTIYSDNREMAVLIPAAANDSYLVTDNKENIVNLIDLKKAREHAKSGKVLDYNDSIELKSDSDFNKIDFPKNVTPGMKNIVKKYLEDDSVSAQYDSLFSHLSKAEPEKYPSMFSIYVSGKYAVGLSRKDKTWTLYKIDLKEYDEDLKKLGDKK